MAMLSLYKDIVTTYTCKHFINQYIKETSLIDLLINYELQVVD